MTLTDQTNDINNITANTISYDSYLEKLNQAANVDETNLNEEEKDNLSKTKLNIQRVNRIHKTYNEDENLKAIVSKIDAPQKWILISETWCGDSAQNVPYIVEMTKFNPLIDLEIVLRDENPEFMDLYLTNGTRSIPKLIAFNEEGQELFQWGPRPKEGADLVKKLKDEGKSKTEFLEQLHLWYGRNRGKALEKEFIELLSSI